MIVIDSSPFLKQNKKYKRINFVQLQYARSLLSISIPYSFKSVNSFKVQSQLVSVISRNDGSHENEKKRENILKLFSHKSDHSECSCDGIASGTRRDAFSIN